MGSPAGAWADPRSGRPGPAAGPGGHRPRAPRPGRLRGAGDHRDAAARAVRCLTSRPGSPIGILAARIARRHRRGPALARGAVATTSSCRTSSRSSPMCSGTLVLTYDALADDISPEVVINRILQTVALPQVNAVPARLIWCRRWAPGPPRRSPHPAAAAAERTLTELHIAAPAVVPARRDRRSQTLGGPAHTGAHRQAQARRRAARQPPGPDPGPGSEPGSRGPISPATTSDGWTGRSPPGRRIHMFAR